ncbi:hypothetical protein Gpo141_00004237, partial [Globisporangium polare]
QKLRDQQKNFHQVRGVSVRLLDESTVSLASSGTGSRRQSDSSDLSDFDDLEITEQKPVATIDEAAVSNQDELSNDDPSDAPLLPIGIRRQSFSIPDHFVKMERSIAEQEALISSIQQQRAMMKAQQGGDAANQVGLPIGAAMRSIAQTKPLVLSLAIENGGVSNNQGEDEAASTVAVTHSNAPSPSSRSDDP